MCVCMHLCVHTHKTLKTHAPDRTMDAGAACELHSAANSPRDDVISVAFPPVVLDAELYMAK